MRRNPLEWLSEPGRGQDARAVAALMPSCASLITSFTSLRLPANEVAQEFDPEGFGLRGADGHAQNLAPAIGVDAHRDYRRR